MDTTPDMQVCVYLFPISRVYTDFCDFFNDVEPILYSWQDWNSPSEYVLIIFLVINPSRFK